MRKRLPSIANTPALLAEWDWEKNAQEGRDPYTTTQGSNKKAWWRCHKGHSFQSPPNGRSSGRGCPYCSGRIAIPGENDLLTVNPQLAEEWDYSQNHTLQIERVLPYSNKRVYWICGVCGNTWQATVNNRSKGSGCPRCAKRFHSSFPEQTLFYYIRKTYPDAINSYREIFSRNRELDIYIPSERIGIEYDGTYAHRTSRIQKDYDKYEICKKHGIRLLRICENPTSSKVDTCDVLIACSYDYRDYSGLVRVLDELRKYLEITQDIDIERDKPFIQQQYMSVLKQSSITSVRPDLAQEWDYEKNNGLTPDMYRYTSGDRVWWRCRACQNSWRAQIYMRSQGVGCPYCANKIVVVGYNDFATRCPDLLSEWAYDKNDISPHNIVWKSSKTVWWKCNTCQRAWKTKIYHRVNGSGCPFCSGRSTKIGENDISITHPHLLKE